MADAAEAIGPPQQLVGRRTTLLSGQSRRRRSTAHTFAEAGKTLAGCDVVGQYAGA